MKVYTKRSILSICLEVGVGGKIEKFAQCAHHVEATWQPRGMLVVCGMDVVEDCTTWWPR